MKNTQVSAAATDVNDDVVILRMWVLCSEFMDEVQRVAVKPVCGTGEKLLRECKSGGFPVRNGYSRDERVKRGFENERSITSLLTSHEVGRAVLSAPGRVLEKISDCWQVPRPAEQMKIQAHTSSNHAP
jgi:hypothetical protein